MYRRILRAIVEILRAIIRLFGYEYDAVESDVDVKIGVLNSRAAGLGISTGIIVQNVNSQYKDVNSTGFDLDGENSTGFDLAVNGPHDLDGTGLLANDENSIELPANDVYSTNQLANDVYSTGLLANYVDSTGLPANDVDSTDQLANDVDGTDQLVNDVYSTGLPANNLDSTDQLANDVDSTDLPANDVDSTDLKLNDVDIHIDDGIDLSADLIISSAVTYLAADDSKSDYQGSDTIQDELDNMEDSFGETEGFLNGIEGNLSSIESELNSIKSILERLKGTLLTADNSDQDSGVEEVLKAANGGDSKAEMTAFSWSHMNGANPRVIDQIVEEYVLNNSYAFKADDIVDDVFYDAAEEFYDAADDMNDVFYDAAEEFYDAADDMNDVVADEVEQWDDYPFCPTNDIATKGSTITQMTATPAYQIDFVAEYPPGFADFLKMNPRDVCSQVIDKLSPSLDEVSAAIYNAHRDDVIDVALISYFNGNNLRGTEEISGLMFRHTIDKIWEDLLNSSLSQFNFVIIDLSGFRLKRVPLEALRFFYGAVEINLHGTGMTVAEDELYTFPEIPVMIA